jgi:anaerobic selenocysteine-containing dehydrogenase
MYEIDEKVGRRKFLKMAGGTVAAGAVVVTITSRGTFGAAEHPITGDPAAAALWGRKAGEWIPSCCNMCGGQSGISWST